MKWAADTALAGTVKASFADAIPPAPLQVTVCVPAPGCRCGAAYVSVSSPVPPAWPVTEPGGPSASLLWGGTIWSVQRAPGAAVSETDP
ncbi:MAG: hypothetical protein AUH85_09225 [Chloroflexi bacterium 13_1_40CM_4_68_4]|nr:MAG: hypothetical protein AUH85_09225 [Chloroflexi bacterium 13_1_40CM_4_68_4]